MTRVINQLPLKDYSFETQLKTVYSFYFGSDGNYDSTFAQILSETLDYSRLSRTAFIVLAWLLGTSGKEFSIGEAARAIGISSAELGQVLNGLKSMSLVKTSDSGVVDIDSEALLNFGNQKKKEEEPLVESPDESVFKMLKGMFIHFSGGDSYNTDSNLKRHVNTIEQFCSGNPGCTFSKGYWDLSAGLNATDKAALLVLAGSFVQKGPQAAIANEERPDLTESMDRLIQKGMAAILPNEAGIDNERSQERFVLSSSACRALFYGHPELVKYSCICNQAEIIRADDIKKKELFFEESDKPIDILKRIVPEKSFREITERLKMKGRCRSVSFLLHGGPGTGKTELVKQLAKESGRDVFNVDVSKIYGSLWGETEKNVKALFRNYKYLECLSEKAPILLLNEADGLLQTRQEGSSNIDRSMAIVQTIILQEMETFEGILAATTNLAGDFDGAFYRRFLFKIEFYTPGVEIRSKIWHAIIPELSLEDIEKLAERYVFSGGQIDNIAKKRDILETLNGVPPTLDDLIAFCEEELVLSKEKSSRRKIGFTAAL